MAYYVPKANIILFSPKVYIDEQNGGSYHTMKDMPMLNLGDGLPARKQVAYDADFSVFQQPHHNSWPHF
jgi:hypothetical protein